MLFSAVELQIRNFWNVLAKDRVLCRAGTNDCVVEVAIQFDLIDCHHIFLFSMIKSSFVSRGTSGQRGFRTDQSGVIRYDRTATATFAASPLQ